MRASDTAASISSTTLALPPLREWDDSRLLNAALEQNEAALRELMRRHAVALRVAAVDASQTGSELDADNAVSELWLSLIENDMRLLRAFDPKRGASLVVWLTIRLSQIVYRREHAANAAPAPAEASKATRSGSSIAPSYGDNTLMRVEEVARRWDLDRKTVYTMIERGQITARRCGRLVRIPRNVIESFESQASVDPERHIKCR